MRNLSYILFLSLIFTLSSCAYTQKVSSDFISMMNAPQNNSNTKLSFEGAYVFNPDTTYHIPTDYVEGRATRVKVFHPYLNFPFFFFDNGTVLYIDRATDSSVISKFDCKEKWGTSNNWGTYQIHHDTINAIIYIPFVAPNFIRRNQMRLTYFRGIISNNAITNWRMVEPYPDIAANWSMNRSTFTFLTAPKDLLFIKVPEIMQINPDCSWIKRL